MFMSVVIYLLVMSESIAAMLSTFATAFTAATAISFAVAAVVSLIACAEGQYDELFSTDEKDLGFWNGQVGKTLTKWWKRCPYCAIAFHALAPLVPNQKNMAMIVAGSATYMAVTSEPAQRIGGKALDLLEKKIDEAIGDVNNGEEEETKNEESSGKESVQGQQT